MIEEISVDEKCRKKGIAKSLLTTLLESAKKKYDVTCVNGATYLGDDDMPFGWYRRIGFEKVDELFLIQGKTDTILKHISSPSKDDSKQK